MVSFVKSLKACVIHGESISKDEAMNLCNAPLDELCESADEIRKYFMKNKFDICAIVNGKCGRCSENCKFCAQSSCSDAVIEQYPLLSPEKIEHHAEINFKLGVKRYSIVTSGLRLSDAEVDALCVAVKRVRDNVGSDVCISVGLLNEEQYGKLKRAGVSRVHNNLETSRNNFANICTSHTFEDKLDAIKAAMRAGLEVCSGGIMGIGESYEDRIDMAFSLRELGVKSIPINMLNPIYGTKLYDMKKLGIDDMRRIVALYRFIIPDSFIRLAGGRGLLDDKGRGCFVSGANAAISGDMLTTSGISAEEDIKMMEELGYEI